MSQHAVETTRITRVQTDSIHETEDKLAVEEPLEIQLIYQSPSGLSKKNIAVTMRTPGNDADLATGFLFTEGIIQYAADIEEIKEQTSLNKVCIVLKESVIPRLQHADRMSAFVQTICRCMQPCKINATLTSPRQDAVVSVLKECLDGAG